MVLEMGADKGKSIVVIRELIFIILAYLVYDGSSDQQHSNFVKNKTNGGVQAAIVTVSLVSAYEQALQSLKQGGRLVLICIPTD
jgi:D-arabinose 1-dehydrogenase-like Zn-dependent alcohol dehydrogenase